jgi:leader peptidase (prepilin peptidase)/N-methyltransferase
MPQWFLILSAGLFGLLFGSFANVVIWRFPRGESISTPGSHCPTCDTPIAWYDNIPVVSWLVLRGRCRSCDARIAARYPLVEVASGVAFAAAVAAFGFGARGLVAACFFWLLLVLALIDLDCMRLPNPLVGALAAIGAVAVLAAQLTGTAIAPLVGVASGGLLSGPLASAGAGVLLGAGLSGGIAAAYGALRGKRGLGMGDVKLLGAMGLFLGPYTIMSLFFGSLLGVVAGVIGARGRGLREARLPFGPWLAVGGVITALAGPAILAWYLGLAGISL